MAEQSEIMSRVRTAPAPRGNVNTRFGRYGCNAVLAGCKGGVKGVGVIMTEMALVEGSGV